MVNLESNHWRQAANPVSFTRSKSRVIVLALCALCFGAAGAAAEEEALARFLGEFRGTGVAEGEANDFGISVRGLDVAIERAKRGGFLVRWSALYRTGGENDPKYRLKLAQAEFQPTKREGIYRAVSSTREESGRWIGWARIAGDTMTVYQLLLEDSGSFQLTSHERTLTDTGMLLRFVRRRDSGVVRVVTGALEKTSG